MLWQMDYGTIFFEMLTLNLVTTTAPSRRKHSIASDVSVALSNPCILPIYICSMVDAFLHSTTCAP